MDRAIIQDYSRLIGIPYIQSDCWSITREFYRIVFNIDLKHYYDSPPNDLRVANNLIYSSLGDFEKTSFRGFGDIILIKIGGIESHIAVYLGGGKMLHTSKNTGSVIENTTRWEKSITGYYRIKK